MIDSDTAAENLRVIRNLMERATVYRALSAPAALFAAVLVFPVALVTGMFAEHISPLGYYFVWIGVLLMVGVFNTLLLWKDARKRGADMVTSSFRHAVKSLVPPLFSGGVISFLMVGNSRVEATLCWLVFYGLAMLATHGFAPPSMLRLGGAFTGIGLILWGLMKLGVILSPETEVTACWIMAGTFGLLHLIYGISVGRRTGFRLNPGDNV